MLLRFEEASLERLATESDYLGEVPAMEVRAFRMRIQALMAAPHENTITPLRALGMQARGRDEHVIRVTDRSELVVAFVDEEKGRTAVVKSLSFKESM